MLNNLISNPLAGGIWLVAGGAIAAWYRARLSAFKAARLADDGSPETRR